MLCPASARQTESPRASKSYAANETLAGIVQVLAPLWVDKARSATPDGKEVMSFLLNVVSCVYLLPPESELTLPCLDIRLLPAFASLCASEPYLSRRYPEIAGVAVRIDKTMTELCLLAGELKVDVSKCENKDEVVQALLTSERLLVPVSGKPAEGSQKCKNTDQFSSKE